VNALEIMPIIVTIIEVFKRFIPNKYRTWANPVLALVLGLGIAYTKGGVPALTEGLVAAAGAVGTYKIPKVVGEEFLKSHKLVS